MTDFLTFRKMLVPILVEAIFIGGTVVCLIAGIWMVLSRSATSARLAGVAVALAGPLALRIALELVVVLFAIQETLVDIRDELRLNSVQTPPGS